jgi:hypothetical protein
MRDDQSLWGMTEILRGHDLADATLRICGLGDAKARAATPDGAQPLSASSCQHRIAIAKERK